jgi:hypothetical protein
MVSRAYIASPVNGLRLKLDLSAYCDHSKRKSREDAMNGDGFYAFLDLPGLLRFLAVRARMSANIWEGVCV